MRFKMTAIAAAALFAIASPAHAQTPAEPPKSVLLTVQEEKVASEWLGDHAKTFEPGAIRAADYQAIIAALGSVKVYGIGEVTHGTHEDQQFKADLIKQLILSGKIDTIALESSYRSGLAFDDYVKSGTGDPVALVRSTDFFRIWKGDEFTSLLTWVRAYNLQATKPVSIIGVDVQLPARDAQLAIDELASRDAAEAARYRPIFAPFFAPDGEDPPRLVTVWTAMSAEQQATALEAAAAMLAGFDREATTQTGAAFDRAHESARRVWQGLSSYEYNLGDANLDWSKVPAEAVSRRDRYMGENLLRLTDKAEGVALWAHNSHVLANYDQLYEDAGWMTLGRVLKKRLGDQYKTIGFTYTTAEALITKQDSFDAAMIDDKVWMLSNDTPATTGRLFDGAASERGANAIWLRSADLEGTDAPRALSSADFFFGEAGWAYVPSMFQNNTDNAAGVKLASYDVVIWFRHMTPQRRWPNVPYSR